MNRAEVGIFEEPDEVRFGSLLQCPDRLRLKSEVSLEILSDLADESLERQLADQKFRRLLEPPNFSKCNSSWTKGKSQNPSSQNKKQGTVLNERQRHCRQPNIFSGQHADLSACKQPSLYND